MVSGNKAQVHEIYVQIDDFAASLVRAVPDITMLSPTAKVAIQVLTKYAIIYHARLSSVLKLFSDVEAVRKDMEGIGRHNRLARFIRAKRDSNHLQSLRERLGQADAAFTVGLVPLLARYYF